MLYALRKDRGDQLAETSEIRPSPRFLRANQSTPGAPTLFENAYLMLESESYAIFFCNGRAVGSDGQRYITLWLLLRGKNYGLGESGGRRQDTLVKGSLGARLTVVVR